MVSRLLRILLGLATAIVAGCGTVPDRAPGLTAPYAERRVFAVAPLLNESGSAAADTLRLADRLTEQLTLTRRVDTLPVNRVLAAMEAAGIRRVASREQALRLTRTLGIDALVVGTVTSYDPYDPPRLGLNVDLYFGDTYAAEVFDIRRLSRSATDTTQLRAATTGAQPVSAFSALWDASHPVVQDRLHAFGVGRGTDYGATATEARLYRISMDLYSSFVAYEACRRLMDLEFLRLGPHAVPRRGDDAPRGPVEAAFKRIATRLP